LTVGKSPAMFLDLGVFVNGVLPKFDGAPYFSSNTGPFRIYPYTLCLYDDTGANFAVLPPQLTTVFIVGMVMIIRITIIIMIILTIYIKQPQKLHLFLNLLGVNKN